MSPYFTAKETQKAAYVLQKNGQKNRGKEKGKLELTSGNGQHSVSPPGYIQQVESSSQVP